MKARSKVNSVEIRDSKNEVKAIVGIEPLINRFGFGLKMVFPEDNQSAYVEMSKHELEQLYNKIAIAIQKRI